MTGKSAAGTLKVGIYCPDGNGGSSGGAMGIFRFLNSSEGISARMISRVNRSRIKDYDCLIIPSVMKLGNDDTPAEMESALKWYVEELGRGVMFEHNSVGIERGGIKRSFFPDICGGAMKRVEDTALTVSSGRFLRAGSYKHIYFDHIALLKGGKGQVISTDKFNNPVHICGTEKKGRVLFSGTVTLAPDGDKELEEVSGFEAALLLSGVKWLCGDNG
jgi:hypothetical protein